MKENESTSQLEVNKAVRILQGKQVGKLTALFHMADGRMVEVSCDQPPNLYYNNEARELWYNFVGSDYSSAPMCRASLVDFVTIEQNEAKK